MMLNILERFDLKALGQDTAARLHVLAEAARLAFRDRDAALCDTGHAEMPVARLLDKGYASAAGPADRPRARDGRHAAAAAGCPSRHRLPDRGRQAT